MKTLNCWRYICSTVFWPSKEEIVSYTAVIYRDAQSICWHLCMVLLLAENKHKEMTDKPKGGHVVFAWMCINEISQYPSAVTMSGWLRINREVVFYRLFWGKFSLGQLGLDFEYSCGWFKLAAAWNYDSKKESFPFVSGRVKEETCQIKNSKKERNQNYPLT